MKIIYPLILSTAAGLSTVLGSFLVYLKVKNIDNFVCFCLSFSMGIMVSISIFELLPESIIYIFAHFKSGVGVLLILTPFLVGIGIISIINRNMRKNSNTLYKLGLLSALALMIHNFPEGIATFMSSYSDLNKGLGLSAAIMLHNIPEGISIAIPLFYSGMRRGKSILLALISGLAEPVGAILAYLLLYRYINDLTISIILILTSGIMISLAIEEIYPEISNYNIKKTTYIGIISGVLLTIVNLLIF